MAGSLEVDICFKAGLGAAHTAAVIEISTLDRHEAAGCMRSYASPQ